MTDAKAPLPMQLIPRGELPRSWDARPRYFWEAPAGVTLDDVQQPSYWREVSRFFKQRYAVVEVVSVSGAWECTLSAVDILSDGGVEMRLTSLWQAPDEAMPALPDGYTIQLSANGWTVFDGNDARRGPIVTAAVSERKARELANADFEKRSAFVLGSR